MTDRPSPEWIVKHDPNAGGCNAGHVVGWRSEWNIWAVWRLADGKALALFPSDRNQHGHDHGETRAKQYHLRLSPDFNPALLEGTP